MALAGDLVLRPAQADDATGLTAVEFSAFPDPSWRGADFLRYDCTVAEWNGTMAGFLVSRETFAGNQEAPPEREVLNLAVLPGFRRLGIAMNLLRHEISRATALFLEVRKSNEAAIRLYEKAGFTKLAERPHYYSQPSESAIVMRLKW